MSFYLDENHNPLVVKKLIFNRVFGREFKPVHNRDMVVSATAKDLRNLTEILDQKAYFKNGSLETKLTPYDVAKINNIVTLSDVVHKNPVAIENGWTSNRYIFIMHLVLKESERSFKNYYLQGYTDTEDVVTFTGEINPNINLIFNSCIITQDMFIEENSGFLTGNNGYWKTRLLHNFDIYGKGDYDINSCTRPFDIYAKIQSEEMFGRMERFGNGGMVSIDTRSKINPGNISKNNNKLLTNHLTEIANTYMSQSNLSVGYSREDVIDSAASIMAEGVVKTHIPLFKRLYEKTGISQTNEIRFEILKELVEFNCLPDVANAYNMAENLAIDDKRFKVLTTMDSEYLNTSSVITKMANITSSGISSIMSSNMLTNVAFVVDSTITDYTGLPIVSILELNTVVENVDKIKLAEGFKDVLRTLLLPQITFNNEATISLVVTASIYTNIKLEISYNGDRPVVYNLPVFAETKFSNISGSESALSEIANSYRYLFEELDNFQSYDNRRGLNGYR